MYFIILSWSLARAAACAKLISAPRPTLVAARQLAQVDLARTTNTEAFVVLKLEDVTTLIAEGRVFLGRAHPAFVVARPAFPGRPLKRARDLAGPGDVIVGLHRDARDVLLVSADDVPRVLDLDLDDLSGIEDPAQQLALLL